MYLWIHAHIQYTDRHNEAHIHTLVCCTNTLYQQTNKQTEHIFSDSTNVRFRFIIESSKSNFCSTCYLWVQAPISSVKQTYLVLPAPNLSSNPSVMAHSSFPSFLYIVFVSTGREWNVFPSYGLTITLDKDIFYIRESQHFKLFMYRQVILVH